MTGHQIFPMEIPGSQCSMSRSAARPLTLWSVSCDPSYCPWPFQEPIHWSYHSHFSMAYFRGQKKSGNLPTPKAWPNIVPNIWCVGLANPSFLDPGDPGYFSTYPFSYHLDGGFAVGLTKLATQNGIPNWHQTWLENPRFQWICLFSWKSHRFRWYIFQSAMCDDTKGYAKIWFTRIFAIHGPCFGVSIRFNPLQSHPYETRDSQALLGVVVQPFLPRNSAQEARVHFDKRQWPRVDVQSPGAQLLWTWGIYYTYMYLHMYMYMIYIYIYR